MLDDIIFEILEAEDFAEALDTAIAEMQWLEGISVRDPSRLFASLEGGDAPNIPLSIGGIYAEEWKYLPNPERAFHIIEDIYWRELGAIFRNRAERAHSINRA